MQNCIWLYFVAPLLRHLLVAIFFVEKHYVRSSCSSEAVVITIFVRSCRGATYRSTKQPSYLVFVFCDRHSLQVHGHDQRGWGVNQSKQQLQQI